MENENKGNKPIGPLKKSKDIVITRNQLKKIALAMYLTLICIFCIYLVITYFNSGLTHRKAKQVFIDDWNNGNSEKLEEVKVLGIKKIKAGTYWVKISYSYWQKKTDWTQYRIGVEKETEEQKTIRESEFEKNNPPQLRIDQEDYIYTKWDTGWFIEEKKK